MISHQHLYLKFEMAFSWHCMRNMNVNISSISQSALHYSQQTDIIPIYSMILLKRNGWWIFISSNSENFLSDFKISYCSCSNRLLFSVDPILYNEYTSLLIPYTFPYPQFNKFLRLSILFVRMSPYSTKFNSSCPIWLSQDSISKCKTATW